MATVKQILDMSLDDIQKMGAKDLKKAVQVLASAANKRLKRLEATEIGREAPAYKSATQRTYATRQGGKFGTEGKNLNQLRNEFKAVTKFLKSKTGSVTGWKDVREETYERIGGRFSNVDEEKEYWKNYRRLMETNPNLGSMAYGSKNVQADLKRIMTGENVEEDIEQINRANIDMYEPYELADVEKTDDEELNKKRLKAKREKMIKELTENGYVIDSNGELHQVNPSEPEDAAFLMSLKIGVEYEQEQSELVEHDSVEYRQI